MIINKKLSRKKERKFSRKFFKKFALHLSPTCVFRMVEENNFYATRSNIQIASGSYWSHKRREIGFEIMSVNPVKSLYKGQGINQT